MGCGGSSAAPSPAAASNNSGRTSAAPAKSNANINAKGVDGVKANISESAAVALSTLPESERESKYKAIYTAFGDGPKSRSDAKSALIGVCKDSCLPHQQPTATEIDEAMDVVVCAEPDKVSLGEFTRMVCQVTIENAAEK